MVTRIADRELKSFSRKSKLRRYGEVQRTNMNYLRDHYEELVKKYPNHWVMIGGGKFISTASNPDQLISKLSSTRTSNKIVYYLASPRKRMLL